VELFQERALAGVLLLELAQLCENALAVGHATTA
jgi:hypothetical protein